MQAITFNFKADVEPDQQEAELAKINAWQGVQIAGRTQPDTPDPEISRMGYVYLEENSDPTEIADQLAKIPVIETVSIPSKRRLV
jgi:hypothetical protein